MGMKFLNKKGWHTGSLRNIENVWKAEQKHEAEQKKLEELRKQILEEKERSEFRRLQEQAGLVPRQERLDFLYDSGLSVGKSNSDGGFKALEALPQPNNNEAAGSSSSGKQDSGAPGALFEDKPQSANDAWRKLHSDPLLMIRQREQEALARIKNNPVKMAMIRKSVESKKHEDDDDGRDKVKRKHRKQSSLKQRSDSEDDTRGKAKRSKKEAKHRGSKHRDYIDSDKEKEDERSSRQHKESERSDRRHRDSERSSRQPRDFVEEDERSSRRHKDFKEEDERSSRRHRGFEREDERSSRRPRDSEKEDERSSRQHKESERSDKWRRDSEREDERSSRQPRDSEKEDERSSRRCMDSQREARHEKYRERSPVESRPEKSENHSPTKSRRGMSKNEKTQAEDNQTSAAVSVGRYDSGSHHRRRNAAPKLSAEERAARLREMQRDAELHEEQRWRRLKKADENDAKEAAQPVVSGGKTFLDAAQKTVYGAEQGGCTIEESVRRRSHYLQHRSAAEGNAFRR